MSVIYFIIWIVEGNKNHITDQSTYVYVCYMYLCCFIDILMHAYCKKKLPLNFLP